MGEPTGFDGVVATGGIVHVMLIGGTMDTVSKAMPCAAPFVVTASVIVGPHEPASGTLWRG